MKIKGFPGYEVTEDGEVYAKNGKKMHPYDKGNGYKQVKLFKDGKKYPKSIHKLVVESRGDNRGDLDIDHIDGNKSNNKSSNLRLIKHRDNVKRIFKPKNGK